MLDIIIVTWIAIVCVVLAGSAHAIRHPNAWYWLLGLATLGCAAIGLYLALAMLTRG